MDITRRYATEKEKEILVNTLIEKNLTFIKLNSHLEHNKLEKYKQDMETMRIDYLQSSRIFLFQISECEYSLGCLIYKPSQLLSGIRSLKLEQKWFSINIEELDMPISWDIEFHSKAKINHLKGIEKDAIFDYYLNEKIDNLNKLEPSLSENELREKVEGLKEEIMFMRQNCFEAETISIANSLNRIVKILIEFPKNSGSMPYSRFQNTNNIFLNWLIIDEALRIYYFDDFFTLDNEGNISEVESILHAQLYQMKPNNT